MSRATGLPQVCCTATSPEVCALPHSIPHVLISYCFFAFPDDGTGSDGTARLLDVTQLCEKPTLQYARAHLHVPGLPEDSFLTMFGQYIVSPKVFDYLQADISGNARAGGEFQFTTALERLVKDQGLVGLLVEGHRFDIGTPASYMHTVRQFRGVTAR